jgi:hypothetical protein
VTATRHIVETGKVPAQATATTEYRLAIVLFAATWLLMTVPWLEGAVTIPYDAKALFQSQLQFLANAFHSGQSPYWNPSTFVGVPQISDPQSLMFSPAVLLAYFERVPSFRQLDVFVLSLLLMGGLAIQKFCQDKGWHPAAGLVAAIVFAFGASAAWRIQHITHIQSLAFFAVALWLLARALDRSSALYGALGGLAAGVMVVEANQVAFLGCYVLAGYCLNRYLLARDRRAALRGSVRPLASCALVAISIAGLPLLLTYLFLESSNRPEIAWSEAVRGSLHPASLLTAIVPGLFGTNDPAVTYWGPFSEWWNKNELTLSPNMSQVYLGTLPMLLILTAGLLRGALWSREIRFYAIAAAALLVYALGNHTPAFSAFFHFVPGVSFFRRPVDAVILVGALLSILAGYLVHHWLSGSLPAASYRRKAMEAGLLAVILLAALATALELNRTLLALKPLALSVLWIAAALLLLSTPARWLKLSRNYALLAPALLVGSDLALNNGPNDATALPASAAAYEVLHPNCRNGTIRFLRENLRRHNASPWRDRVEFVGVGFEWQNAALVHGFEGTLGYNPFRLGGVADATGARDYIAGADQKTFSPLLPSYASPMANLLGLRFIVVGVPIEEVDKKLKPGELKLVARTADAYVYENEHVLPRVHFVTDWLRADFDAMIRSGKWPHFDPMHTVLLNKTARTAAAKPPAHPARGSSAAIRTYENTKVVIEVEAAEPGFVVLHDVWHPWWAADIDGIDVPILQANVLFRAVQVPAGRHVLTFAFEPIAGAIADLGDKLRETAR